jgi:hypothetical protein
MFTIVISPAFSYMQIRRDIQTQSFLLQALISVEIINF